MKGKLTVLMVTADAGSVLIRLGGRTPPGLGLGSLCVLVSLFAWRFLRESHAMTATEEREALIPHSGQGAIQGNMTLMLKFSMEDFAQPPVAAVNPAI